MNAYQTFTLILIALLGLAGCAALLSEHEDRGRLAVQYATLKAIDGQQSRAERVQAWVSDAQSYVDASEEVTIDRLDEEVRERIRWERLDAADQLLIDRILTNARERLESELSGGLLDEPERQRLGTVLEWIAEAAAR